MYFSEKFIYIMFNTALISIVLFFINHNFTNEVSTSTTIVTEPLKSLPITPQPLMATPKAGVFTINAQTQVFFANPSDELNFAVNSLNNKLKKAANFSLNITSQSKSHNEINISLDDKIKNEEGYEINVTKNKIFVISKTAIGVFYAFQTLRQLLPSDIENQETTSKVAWTIPCCDIKDEPRYSWRGLHLDVCRHFFDVNFIKKYIDLMAMYKFNRFHWHLTDDQGWRIEIKKYPKLTEVSSFRKETLIGSYAAKPERYDATPYSGFYTQEQIKEVVQYAKERFVMVIPEIEMPGHSLAALAAYPELSCSGGSFDVGTRWGVYDDVYCPKETTLNFLRDVLDETAALFPAPYIHIGGDECPKTRWKTCQNCQNLIKKEGLKDELGLQSYVVRTMEKHINAKGKKLIGWDEILEGGLSDNATVMSWRGTEGGVTAAKQHHDVIMTPGTHCYFDHYQSKDKNKEPLAIGGFTSVEKVYSYEPTPSELNTEQQKYILGAQGNVWTEYIQTPSQVEYMAYPRAIAMAEVLWTASKNKNWTNFSKKLQQEFVRLEKNNTTFAKHLYVNNH